MARRHRPPRWRAPLIGLGVVVLLLGWGARGHWQTIERAKATQRETIDFEPMVQVARAQRVDAPVDVTLPGQSEAFDASTIFARATGYVAERAVDIGSRVHRGDLLLRIAAPDLDAQLVQAQAQLAQNRAALVQAQANVQSAQANSKLAQVTNFRESTLARSGWETQQNADNASANLAAQAAAVAGADAGVHVAEANIAAQEATVQRLQTLAAFERVVAPFDGVVTARNVDVGDLVNGDQNSGTPLFAMDREDVLRIAVDVPQSDTAGMRDGVAAEARVPELPGRVFKGVVARSSVALSQNARTLMVEVDVPNPDDLLRPGLYMDVTFHVPRQQPGVVVPDSALAFNAEGLHVLLLQPDGTVRAQPVDIYRDFGTSAELRTGLKGGEQLVLNPPADLNSGDKVHVGSQSAGV